MVVTHRAPNREDTSTQEQRDLVIKIRRTRNYYEILGLQRTATDEEIKRAYRRLALKLHPDKCTAANADEAFKLVSKAFSCLSDGDKRAAYDRYGEETPGLSRPANGGAGGAPFGFNDGFDPEQVFNMFFNGGFPAGGAGGFGGGPMFRAHFGPGGFQQRRRPGGPQQAQQPATPAAQLMHLVPVVLLLLFTFLQMPSAPVYSLDKLADYRHAQETARVGVPYYIKDPLGFEKAYPKGGRSRARLEVEIEQTYKEQLEQRCYSERINQQTLFRWGQAERARAYQMPNCERLKGLYGATRVYA